MIFDDGTLVFATAMTAGVTAQGIARHLAIPGIVLLLATGVLLGPDVADVIRPRALGSGLSAVVSFAVAVVLFEGGLNLRVDLLRKQGTPILRLVTTGAIITAAGGTAAALVGMGWNWRLSALFGTLVIVTGPTVVTPILRRLRVRERVATILEAEGVFIDAVGATIAVVALEIAIAPSRASVESGLVAILTRPAIGLAVGVALGMVLVLLLRSPRLVPRGLESTLALAVAVFTFELSDGLAHESGITAAIAAGLVVGNWRTRALRDIEVFKERMTVLLIATLFVLLAATVRMDDVIGLGWRGVVTVTLLAVVVRPLGVWMCTRGTGISTREKLFMSWLAPRGIVAAAVASLFAIELDAAGIPGGAELQALVFLVIASTVTIQGLGASFAARILGVEERRRGYVIVGANALGIELGRQLAAESQKVIVLDVNSEACAHAEDAGLIAICANGLEEETLARAGVERRRGALAVTGNASVNQLFGLTLKELFPATPAVVAIDGSGVHPEVVEAQGLDVLFGGQRCLGAWIERAAAGRITVETWFVVDPPRAWSELLDDDDALLPLYITRGDGPVVVGSHDKPRRGDAVVIAMDTGRAAPARAHLRARGLRPESAQPAPASESL